MSDETLPPVGVVALRGVARIVRSRGTDELHLLRDEVWSPARLLDQITARESRDADLAWNDVRTLAPKETA